jgi:sugar (pentulose or hexulose) kinase
MVVDFIVGLLTHCFLMTIQQQLRISWEQWNRTLMVSQYCRSGPENEARVGRPMPAEIVRAALEAISYRFALIAQSLETVAPQATVIATGNALRSSPVWLQIMSDVLGRQLKLGGSSEASTRGAALLALEAVGKIGSIEEVVVPIDAVFDPDMSRHERYQGGLRRQQETYERLLNG